MNSQTHLWLSDLTGSNGAERAQTEIANLALKHCLTVLDSAVAVRYTDGSFTLYGEPYVIIGKNQGGLAAFLLSLTLGAPPLAEGAVGAVERRIALRAILESTMHSLPKYAKDDTR